MTTRGCVGLLLFAVALTGMCCAPAEPSAGERPDAIAPVAAVADELPRIREMTKSPDSRVRADAMYELARRRVDADEAVPLLVVAMKDPARNVRASAARALGLIGRAGTRAELDLVGLLGDKDEWVRDAAVEGLMGVGMSRRALDVAKAMVGLRAPELDAPEDDGLPDGPKVARLVERIRTGEPAEVLAALREVGRYGPLAAPDLPVITPYLEHRHWEARLAAVVAVASIAPRRDVARYLRPAIGDKNESVRTAAALSLGVLENWRPAETKLVEPAAPADSESYIEGVLARLDSPNHFVRSDAAQAMRRLGLSAAEHAPKVARLLKDEVVYVRADAAAALVAMGAGEDRPPEAVVGVLADREVRRDLCEALAEAVSRSQHGLDEIRTFIQCIARLADVGMVRELGIVGSLIPKLDEPSLRLGLLDALGNWGTAASVAGKAVAECLRDRDKAVRAKATWALGRFGIADWMVDGLLASTRDPDAEVRRAAAGALAGRVADRVDVFKALARAMDRELDGETYKAFAAALAQSKRGQLRELRMELKGGPPDTRRLVAEKMWAFGPAATGPLAEALGDPVAEVRIAAAGSLGRMGPSASGAREALAKAAKDREADVRTAATAALKAVTGE